ncbi:hypothetical protein HVZ55_16135 [Escherichia fergusonii]|nr:hypothetical protein [Escherichia fergusonii]
MGSSRQYATGDARRGLPAGRDFPVFLHPQTHEEYALARTERKSGSGYTGLPAMPHRMSRWKMILSGAIDH